MNRSLSFSFLKDQWIHPYIKIIPAGDAFKKDEVSSKNNRVRGGLTFVFIFTVLSIRMVGQTQAFIDNFNRATLTSGSPTTYTVTGTAGDGGAAMNNSSFLELTNDSSSAANVDGIVYVSGSTQNFNGTFNQVLHSNVTNVEWTFNFRYKRVSNPSGLGAGSYGTAIILACSNGVFTGTGAGNGYAVVYASTGTPDPIRLVKFSGGLNGTVATIISSGNNDISAVNNYVSVRVKYEPSGDNWSLFIRDDGDSTWADPAVGNTIQKGSITSDNTFTSLHLTHFGFYWAYATAAVQTSQFDNFGVSLTSVNAPAITVSTSSLPSFGNVAVGNSSSLQNFTVRGINLTDNIVLTSPTGFEIRTGTNPFSGNPITLNPLNGAVPETTIDVRFSPGTINSFSGTIACTTTGGITKTVSVSGIGGGGISLPGLELFITSDPTHADADHAVLFPHTGMSNGATFGGDDWSYSSPQLIFYVVPTGSQSMGASEFELNWDPAEVNVSITNGTMFDFFAIQNVADGKVKINTGANSGLNVSPSSGKYLVKLECTVLKPGCNEITATGMDFRYFDGEAQQNIQVLAHPGVIKFYLGDYAAHNNVTTCGDGKINFDDLVQFALTYFSESDGGHGRYKAKFDIGPTNSTRSYFAMPNPDGRVQFEDLALFSIGYGKTATFQLSKEHRIPVVFSTQPVCRSSDDLLTVPLAVSGGTTDIRALSVSLSYPSSTFEYRGFKKCGEMNQDDCFMDAQATDTTVTLDAAGMGSEQKWLTRDGIFADVIFKQRTKSKNTPLTIQSAIARDNNNQDVQTRIDSKQISTTDVPAAFALAQNYPNPFNSSTTIRYELPSPAYVNLAVYDLLGRKVARLISEQEDAGLYRVEWNGTNSQQQPVSSGVYFYRFRAEDRTTKPGNSYIFIKKMVFLK